MSALSGSSRLESFIDERMKYRSLRPQFAIAFVAGLLFAGNFAAVYLATWGTEARTTYEGVMYAMGLVSVFVPIVVWITGTFITFVLARLIGARVEFGVLLRSTGWGNIPMIGTTAALAAGRYVGIGNVDVCSLEGIVCDLGQVVDITDQVNHIFVMMGVATDTTVFLAAYGVAVLCFLVTGYFWYFAAYRASTLTRAGAGLTTGVSVVASLALLTLAVF